jgi:hypothetical protein
MRKVNVKAAHIGLIVFIMLAMVSCDNFFSTTWGKARDYDLSKITLTQSNLESWKNKAVGNPELAKALVEKIIGNLDGLEGAEKAAYQNVGISLAIEQSGIGTIILNNAGKDLDKVINGGDADEGVMIDLLKNVQKDFGDGGKAAAESVATIANASKLEKGEGDEDEIIPRFPLNDPYTSLASASDVGSAVLVLALALVPDMEKEESVDTLADKIEKFHMEDDGTATVEEGASPEAFALAAYLNLINDDTTGKFSGNPITDGIKTAFKNKGEGE